MAKYQVPAFIKEALTVLRPPEKLTVSEWADKYRVLDSKTSAIPGQWKTSQTPYLRGIMDSFNDPEIEEIIFVKPTQVGGTECLNNIIGYIVAQDPSPTLVVYPTLDLAEYTSDNRLQPMFKISPVLKDKYNEKSKKLELQCDGMYIVLSGANSPASLASRPIRFLLLDEVDKYPTNAGKEASPTALARERTKTFANNKKIFQTSTPTLKTGPIWQEWENADSQMKYFVPCPHCGKYQIFEFKQLKWKKTKNPEEARDTAYYLCNECNHIITDQHRFQMIANGQWRHTKKKGSRKTAFWLNVFYSPWVRLGDIAYEFVVSKNFPDLLMNFINSWLAEPWEDVESSSSAEKVLKKNSNLKALEVPEGTVMITGGADVQKKCIFYTIRAWTEDMTNYNIAHGQIYSFNELEYVMNTTYYDKNDQGYMVNLCCVDSGDQTDDVYDFCSINAEWATPIKGSSRKIYGKYNVSRIDKQNSKANGMKLVLIDTDFYKNMIFARLKREQGGFYIYDECDVDYAEQITSEHKVIEKKNGKLVETWKPKKSNIDNHYLDAEVYCFCAADLCGIRDIHVQSRTSITENKSVETHNQASSNSWLNIHNEGSWLKR